MEVEAIKNSYPLSVIYENLTGNQLKQTGGKLSGLCPFHDDHTAGNFYIYPENNSFNCFSCGAAGDNIKFVQRHLNKSFPDAVHYLTGENLQQTIKTAKNRLKQPIIKPAPELSDTSKQIYKYFADNLTLTNTGKAYLLGRGLSEKVINKFNLKSIDNPNHFYCRLTRKFKPADLITAGIAGKSKDDKLYFSFYLPCIIFSVIKSGEPVYFSSRNFSADKKQRFFKLHTKQFYFSGNLSAPELLIFEGILDAISFYQLTGNDNFIVLSGLNNRLYSDIVSTYPNKRIVIVFDNDQAADTAKEKLKQSLGYAVPELDFKLFCQHFGVKQNCKDINDILKIHELKKGNQAVFKTVLNSLSDLDKERFEEKAAIMEYSGNLSRDQAELNALLGVIGEL